MLNVELIKTGFEFLLSSGVAVTGWKWIENIYRNRKIEKSTKTLANMALVYDQLNYMVSELNCTRCMLVYTSNGGGTPNVGKNIYFTALYEVKDSNIESIRSLFQNVLVDEEHTMLLNKILHNTLVIEEPANLKDSYLKSSYEFQEVEKFAYFEVQRTAERFYYLAVNWHDKTRIPEVSDIKSVCLSAATNIKTILLKG